MLAYLLPVSISCLLGFFSIGKLPKYSPQIIFIVVFLGAFVFCGGYMTGSDWRNYEVLYTNANWSLLSTYEHEKGFYFYVCIMKTIGFGFFPFLILTKFTVFVIITKFIYKYADNFYIAFAMFLMIRGMTIFVDNPFRYMIALGICTYAIDAAIQKKVGKFIVLCSIAFFFHISSLIIGTTIFFRHIRINKFILIILYCLLFFLINPNNSVYFIGRFYPDIALLLGRYYNNAELVTFSLFSIGRIVYLLFFLIIIINREVLVAKRYGEELYSIAILFFFINIFSYALPTLHRLAMYYDPVFAIALSIVLVNTIKYKKILRCFVFMYLFMSFYSNMYVSYTYIPYSNYFIHCALGKEYDFDYRSNFNKKKYFERTGKNPSDIWSD